ncbi:ROK family transcriptional regulator [Asticcacaulis machinosus]|uniref:ROK family transcriptional regulator n=1 Tax=Asticcacaulis machinosus TaxID=2984211 RepID=A0ABT5HI41_9CAUL|nr:ROK family transcriptional regulator [Asticcacaulis machinosus]MDC7675914.1 ROK family transcriptional regulator [Asticcacaulis machinosus]
MSADERVDIAYKAPKPANYGEGLSGTNLERAGDHNQRVTLQAIRANGPITRADLAQITGLTAPAIANITKRLLDDNLILKAGRLLGGRGQPATKLVVNPDGAFSIGLNIDRDHIAVVALDFQGKVRARVSKEVHFAMPDDVVAFFKAATSQMEASHAINFERLIGIGIGMPDDLGRVRLPNRPEAYELWSQINIAELFEPILNVPVCLENDATAAAIGEMQFGHGLQTASFIYTLISAGLGGGLVINGHYFRGADGRSGEIGFLPITRTLPDGDKAPASLQDAVSLYALYGHLNAAGFAVSTPADLENLTAAGLEKVDEWIEAAVQHLHDPFLTLSCAINPEAHYVGGRVPAAFIEKLCTRLNENYAKLSDRVPKIAPVTRAALAADAAAMGAAILPFNERFLPIREALMKTA